MKCDKCVKEKYCPYLKYFNRSKETGCVEFQDKKYESKKELELL